jgi:hypothetical protein
MSTENSIEEPTAADCVVETSEGDAPTTEKAKQPQQPMPLKERICLNVSVIAILMAVLNATGLTSGLPAFMAVAVKEQPFVAFCVTGLASGLLAFLLADFIPRKFGILARLPVMTFAAFWLHFAWISIIEVSKSPITDWNAILILISTMLMGFCVAHHLTISGESPALPMRIEVFIWTTMATNLGALAITLLISAAFVGNVKGSIQAKIDSEIDVQKRMEYLWGTCPFVETKEFCDAMKIVTSKK